MKLRPILFQPDMVRAILAGTKTQTRRTINPQPPEDTDTTVYKFATNVTGTSSRHQGKHHWLGIDRNDDIRVKDASQPYFRNPYGLIGDVLWVRETFRAYRDVESDPYTTIYDYAADGPEPLSLVDADGFQVYNRKGEGRHVPFKPSIHMPFEACRLFLEITGLRVERLCDISSEDAIAEGIECVGDVFGTKQWKDYSGTCKEGSGWPVLSYASLWESINGKDSFQKDPQVWVVEFRQIEKPV